MPGAETLAKRFEGVGLCEGVDLASGESWTVETGVLIAADGAIEILAMRDSRAEDPRVQRLRDACDAEA